jgi:hypothetical protein
MNEPKRWSGAPRTAPIHHIPTGSAFATTVALPSAHPERSILRARSGLVFNRRERPSFRPALTVGSDRRGDRRAAPTQLSGQTRSVAQRPGPQPREIGSPCDDRLDIQSRSRRAFSQLSSLRVAASTWGRAGCRLPTVRDASGAPAPASSYSAPGCPPTRCTPTTHSHSPSPSRPTPPVAPNQE